MYLFDLIRWALWIEEGLDLPASGFNITRQPRSSVFKVNHTLKEIVIPVIN